MANTPNTAREAVCAVRAAPSRALPTACGRYSRPARALGAASALIDPRAVAPCSSTSTKGSGRSARSATPRRIQDTLNCSVDRDGAGQPVGACEPEGQRDRGAGVHLDAVGDRPAGPRRCPSPGPRRRGCASGRCRPRGRDGPARAGGARRAVPAPSPARRGSSASMPVIVAPGTSRRDDRDVEAQGHEPPVRDVGGLVGDRGPVGGARQDDDRAGELLRRRSVDLHPDADRPLDLDQGGRDRPGAVGGHVERERQGQRGPRPAADRRSAGPGRRRPRWRGWARSSLRRTGSPAGRGSWWS